MATVQDAINSYVTRAPYDAINQVISNSVSSMTVGIVAPVWGEVRGAFDQLTEAGIIEAVA